MRGERPLIHMTPTARLFTAIDSAEICQRRNLRILRRRRRPHLPPCHYLLVSFSTFKISFQVRKRPRMTMGQSALAQRRRLTAQLAVIAAALALAGLSLVTTARWQDNRAVDDGRVQTQAVDAAERLGNILEGALDTARVRAEGLATTTTMRAAIEAEAAAARDMARAEGFRLTPSPRETIELFQLRARRPPLSLM